MNELNKSPAWQALQQHHAAHQSTQMRQLFATDPDRFPRYTLSAAGLYLDYSKNRITDETLDLLANLE